MQIEFLFNVTLLVSLSVFSALLGESISRFKRAEPWLQGCLFGAATLLVMLFPVRVEEGVFFDGRTVVVSLAGWFFGPLSASLAVLPAMVYRAWLGGAGMTMGLVALLLSAVYGTVAHLRHPPARRLVPLKDLFVFGGVLHLLVAVLSHVLISVETGQKITPYFLTFMPMASVLCGFVLSHEKHRRHLLGNLRLKEEHLRLITENMHDVIWILRLADRKLTYVSPSNLHLTGFTPEEAVRMSLEETLTPESLEDVNQWLEDETILRAMIAKSEPDTPKRFFHVNERHKNGSHVPAEMSVSVLCDREGQPEMVLGVTRDITERLKHEKALRDSEEKYRNLYRVSQEVGTRLQHSLAEKDVLLKEVHHRVKNNLQVITSLLRLETSRVNDTGTLGVLEDMRGRVRSMSLLHESLYRSDNLAAVNMAPYLETLARNVESAAACGSRVRLRVEVEDVALDIDRAVACGLLVNELLSNAFKHAFPPPLEGVATLRMTRNPETEAFCLQVSDTGKGLPDDFETRCRSSLGMELAHDFARQLNSTLHVSPAPPTCFEVRFSLQS